MRKTILLAIVVGVGVGWGAWSVARERARQRLLVEFQELYNGGDLGVLIQKAEERLASHPKDIDALIAAANAYSMKGSVGFSEGPHGNKAVEYADRVLVLEPQHSEAHRIKGYAFEIQERYSDAIKEYDLAIVSNPQNYQALSNKGHAYDLQGNLVEAERWYIQSIHENPNGEHALMNIARLYARQAKMAEAKASLEKLTASSSNARLKAEGFQMLAEIYRSEMNYKDAKRSIDQSIQFDPSVPQAWITRGQIAIMGMLQDSTATQEQMAAEVRLCADKALAIHPTQASAFALLFDLAGALGKEEERQSFKRQALDVIDRDITLGQGERAALRDYLNAQVTVTSVSETGVVQTETPPSP
jgi:tetratricopeptide (TPR) repeat protein